MRIQGHPDKYQHNITKEFWQNDWESIQNSGNLFQFENSNYQNMPELLLRFLPCKDFPQGYTYKFNSSNQSQQNQWNIGRSKQNNIHLQENNMSRVQARIKYDKQFGWLMFDGSDKPSTNGTFVALKSKLLKEQNKNSNPLKVWNNMTFSVGGLHFNCKLNPNTN